jgi:hypothetical protein
VRHVEQRGLALLPAPQVLPLHPAVLALVLDRQLVAGEGDHLSPELCSHASTSKHTKRKRSKYVYRESRKARIRGKQAVSIKPRRRFDIFPSFDSDICPSFIAYVPLWRSYRLVLTRLSDDAAAAIVRFACAAVEDIRPAPAAAAAAADRAAKFDSEDSIIKVMLMARIGDVTTAVESFVGSFGSLSSSQRRRHCEG